MTDSIARLETIDGECACGFDAGKDRWQVADAQTRAVDCVGDSHCHRFYICYRLTLPFLPALAWALALAVVTYPLHGWIERRIKRPNIAAGLAVALNRSTEDWYRSPEAHIA